MGSSRVDIEDVGLNGGCGVAEFMQVVGIGVVEDGVIENENFSTYRVDDRTFLYMSWRLPLRNDVLLAVIPNCIATKQMLQSSVSLTAL